jgi:hypothetical protein
MAGVPKSPFGKGRLAELRDPLRQMRLMLLEFRL